MPAPGLPEPGFSDGADASAEGDIAEVVVLDIELTRALGEVACVSMEGMCRDTAALAAWS